MPRVDYTFGTSLSDAKPMLSTKEPSNRIYTAAPKPIRSAVLVLVKPRNKDISNYSLSIQVSDLYAGTHDVIPLFGDAIINKTSVLVNEKGGFINYKPVDKLPAYGTLILKLN